MIGSIGQYNALPWEETQDGYGFVDLIVAAIGLVGTAVGAGANISQAKKQREAEQDMITAQAQLQKMQYQQALMLQLRYL